MANKIGTSATILTLAAAVFLHLNGDASSRKAAQSQAAVQTIAATAAASQVTDSNSSDESFSQLFQANSGAGDCKPGAKTAACPSSTLPKPKEMDSCALDPACRAALQRYWGLESSHVHVMIASVPDPQQTRLALFTDNALNALQQAAFDAHWELSSQWLPWSAKPGSLALLASTGKKGPRIAREAQPGLLVFRHGAVRDQYDAGVLLMFIVGETPTAGLNLDQFRAARAYMRALGDPSQVDLVMPCFSGSVPSLTKLVDADFTINPAAHYLYRIRSGTATTALLLKAFHKPTGGKNAFEVDVHGLNLNNSDEKQLFYRVLRVLRLRPSEAAVLVEDQSAYARDVVPVEASDPLSPRGAPSSEQPLVLRYPRDISNLRNLYKDAPDTNSADKAQQEIDFSLKDLEPGDDSLPMFSREKTPAEQDAVLTEITNQIRRDGIRLVRITATNVLDLLFLAKILRVHCPDTRVLVTAPDLLFVKESEQTALTGILALSAYPLFFSSKHWLGEHAITHPSTNAEGMYYAAQLLLLDPDKETFNGYAWKGQRSPAAWLTTMDHSGFAPLRLFEGTDANWFEPAQPSREPNFTVPRPPALWTGMVFLLTFINLLCCAWMIYLYRNPRALPWGIVAPDGRHIADAYRLTLLLTALLLLLTMQGVLLIPYGRLCFDPIYILPLCSTLAPAAVSFWLALEIIHKPRPNRARLVILATAFLFAILVLLAWTYCCSRTTDRTGFFFSYRALELQPGTSPLLPILLLLATLLVFTLCHLARFYFAISHRPRLFVASIDSYFSFKMRNCRRDLNRILVAPMNLPFARQLIWGALFFVALLAGLAIWKAWQKLSSAEGVSYDLLLCGLFVVVTLALVLTAVQLTMAWSALQPILTRLQTLPLRSAFSQIRDIGTAGPIWARRFNLQSLAMPTSAVTLLHNLEVLSTRPGWNFAITSAALNSYRRRYSTILGSLLESDAASTRSRKRQLFCSLRYLSAILSHLVTERILVPEWKTRLLLSDTAADPAAAKADDPKTPDAYDTAQAFVALQLSGFINYGVRQIQNLVFAVSLGFGFLLIAMNLCVPQAPQALNRLLLIAFVLLGYLLWRVLSQMERDPILSQLSGTNEGELNREFYLRLIGYGAVPLVGLLSSQFPYIGNFVSSWLEPSLQALH